MKWKGKPKKERNMEGPQQHGQNTNDKQPLNCNVLG